MIGERTGLNDWSTALPDQTLIISSRDTVRPISEIVDVLREGCPSLRFAELTDGGHMAPLTRPDLGHADRDTPLRQCATGLLLPLERKSIEPIAARVDPAQVSATHQSLHHFVAKSDWSDRALLAAIQRQLLPAIERHGSIEAWIIEG